MIFSHISDNLILIPIPVIICTGAAIIRRFAQSRGKYDNRSQIAVWSICAALVLATALVCGLYIDGATVIRYGPSHDLLFNFTGTIACICCAMAVMPFFVLLWGIDKIVRKIFKLRPSNNDWYITSGL